MTDRRDDRADDASAQPILAAAEALAPQPTVADDPAATPRVTTRVEAPSADVVAPAAETALPGMHRGGFTRPPTAPLDLGAFDPQGPQVEFVPTTGTVATPVSAVRPANFAALGLGFSIVGLIAAIVVGLALPIAVTGAVLGAMSLRRRVESRSLASWAIALGVLGVLYSAGWLAWAAYRAGWWT